MEEDVFSAMPNMSRSGWVRNHLFSVRFPWRGGEGGVFSDQ